MLAKVLEHNFHGYGSHLMSTNDQSYTTGRRRMVSLTYPRVTVQTLASREPTPGI